MRMDKSWGLLLVGGAMLMAVEGISAQDAVPAAVPAATAEAVPAPQAATTPAAQVVTTPAAQVPVPEKPTLDAKKAAKETAEADKKAKKAEEAKKKIYTGPNTVIVLPPTPMLDEEGRQRLDPDGQPMFNAAVRQQRDKKGHPLFDEQNKPVFQTATELGYDEHGKKLKVVKEKPPKMIPVSITRGTFTVDGMIGKAELNYNIADLKFIYLYAPGIGTIVVSNHPFPGGKEEKNAFNQRTLTVTTGDHTLQVASDDILLGKVLGKKPSSAYVLVDREFMLPTPYPVVGYGGLTKAPYVWPGSHENAELKGAFVKPPPIPVNLQPVLLLAPCPAGQMRRAAPPVLPGQKAEPQPCIMIPKGKVTLSGPEVKKASATPAAIPAPTPAVAPAASNPVATTTPQ